MLQNNFAPKNNLNIADTRLHVIKKNTAHAGTMVRAVRLPRNTKNYQKTLLKKLVCLESNDFFEDACSKLLLLEVLQKKSNVPSQ